MFEASLLTCNIIKQDVYKDEVFQRQGHIDALDIMFSFFGSHTILYISLPEHRLFNKIFPSIITTQLVHLTPTSNTTMSNPQNVTIRLSITGTVLSPIETQPGGTTKIRADIPTIQKIAEKVKSQLVLKGYLSQKGGHVSPKSDEVIIRVSPGVGAGKDGDMMRKWRACDEVTIHTRLEVECFLSNDLAFFKSASAV